MTTLRQALASAVFDWQTSGQAHSDFPNYMGIDSILESPHLASIQGCLWAFACQGAPSTGYDEELLDYLTTHAGLTPEVALWVLEYEPA